MLLTVPERRGRVARPGKCRAAYDEHLDSRVVEGADRLRGSGPDRLGPQALVDGGCAEDREELGRLCLAPPRVLQQGEQVTVGEHAIAQPGDRIARGREPRVERAASSCAFLQGRNREVGLSAGRRLDIPERRSPRGHGVSGFAVQR